MKEKKYQELFITDLKNNMLLQMDSTTIYGLKDFNGNLKEERFERFFLI